MSLGMHLEVSKTLGLIFFLSMPTVQAVTLSYCYSNYLHAAMLPIVVILGGL